jgi:osmotically-inducible protein OsmY
LPAPEPKIVPSEVAEELRKALSQEGFTNISLEIGDNFVVTLKGTVNSYTEKEKAINLAKNFKNIKTARDLIFVVDVN